MSYLCKCKFHNFSQKKTTFSPNVNCTFGKHLQNPTTHSDLTGNTHQHNLKFTPDVSDELPSCNTLELSTVLVNSLAERTGNPGTCCSEKGCLADTSCVKVTFRFGDMGDEAVAAWSNGCGVRY